MLILQVLNLDISILDDDYAKHNSKDLDDYDSEYDLLPDKKDRKRRPKNEDKSYPHDKTSTDGFWLNKQMQKLSHHTKGIKLDAVSDPKQGCDISNTFYNCSITHLQYNIISILGI